MKKNLHGCIVVFSVIFLIVATCQTAQAGPPEKPGNPGLPGLLAEISELNNIVATQQGTIDQQLAKIEELEEMLSQLQYFAPIPQTGQTVISKDGDDGYWQKGVAPQIQRFIDNEDGTVTDTFTNLMWAISAQHFGIGDLWKMNWWDGIDACNNLILADYDDWRMPNTREMLSIMDYGYYDPALKPGHPFTNVPLLSSTYWSSTTHPLSDNDAFHVPLKNATINHVNKEGLKFIWPVRGGN